MAAAEEGPVILAEHDVARLAPVATGERVARRPRFAQNLSGPPETAIDLSWPPALKPMERLSGDQNGPPASSVPSSLRAARESNRWTHSQASRLAG